MTNFLVVYLPENLKGGKNSSNDVTRMRQRSHGGNGDLYSPSKAQYHILYDGTVIIGLRNNKQLEYTYRHVSHTKAQLSQQQVSHKSYQQALFKEERVLFYIERFHNFSFLKLYNIQNEVLLNFSDHLTNTFHSHIVYQALS